MKQDGLIQQGLDPIDEQSLRRLAGEGFTGLSAQRLGELANWCWDWCEATGSGRYCSLAQTLWALDSWWSEHAVVPETLAIEIESLLISQLDEVLDAEEESTGATLARHLRQSIMPLLSPPERWP